MYDNITTIKSVFGNEIRITYKQWCHVLENHDYMAGQLQCILETITNPDQVIKAKTKEYIALKEYEKTVITHKTCVCIYRDEPAGFLITAFLTSRPDTLLKKGATVWKKLN